MSKRFCAVHREADKRQPFGQRPRLRANPWAMAHAVLGAFALGVLVGIALMAFAR